MMAQPRAKLCGAAPLPEFFAGISVSLHVPCGIPRCEWRAWLAAMRRAAFPEVLPAVELVITGDGEIALANARLLGCTGPTNILSFPSGGEGTSSLLLSAVTLERECVLYGQETSTHARRLLAHGMGHLAGLDHGPAMDEFCSTLETAAQLSL